MCPIRSTCADVRRQIIRRRRCALRRRSWITLAPNWLLQRLNARPYWSPHSARLRETLSTKRWNKCGDWLTRVRSSLHRKTSRSSQDYRFGHPGTDSIGEPRLRCNVFALLSRSILLSSPVRLQIGSGQGVPATPAATLPTPLRPCLSATPRSGCPALAALPSGHRQRPDPAQHVTEQPPVQMSLGQQQPVVAGMFDQTAAGLH